MTPDERPARDGRRALTAAGATLAIAYGSAALDLFRVPMPHSQGNPAHDWPVFIAVLLLTFTHGVGPPFLMRLATGKDGRRAGERLDQGASTFFCFWYGMPILFVGILTGGAFLVGPVLHVLLARRGTRLWTFVQYGVTAICLFTLLAVVSMFSWWWVVPIAAAQVAMMAFVDIRARKYWVPHPLPADPLRTRVLGESA